MSSAPSSPRSPIPAPDFDDDETQMPSMPSPGTPPQNDSSALSPLSSPARNTEIDMSAEPTDLNMTAIDAEIAQPDSPTSGGASKKKASKGITKGKGGKKSSKSSSKGTKKKKADAPVDDKPPVEIDESVPYVLPAVNKCDTYTLEEMDEVIRRSDAYTKTMRARRKTKAAAMKPKGMSGSGGAIDLFWRHFAKNEVDESFDSGVRMPIKATTNHAQKRAIAVKMWKESSDEMKMKVFNLQMEFKTSKDVILARVCS